MLVTSSVAAIASALGVDENLFSADADFQQRENKVPPDTRGEGAAKVPGSSKLFQHGLAEAGPPSQRTRQMEKDLETTLLKRYEEAKALEKKKKKEKAIKKEQP